jgi:nucleoside-diphosphate-sugar epimerase
MKVLVTGATGFIGREIVSELSDGEFEIYQIGNSNVNSHLPQAEFLKTSRTLKMYAS